MADAPLALATANLAIANRATPAPGRTADVAAARRAAEDFEAFFVSQMLENMFKGVKTDGMFGGGQGEDAYRPLLFQEYGKIVAKQGGIGIADAVMRELLQAQEGK